MINTGVVSQNRKARYNFTIEDSIECGILLQGSEVKSLRRGTANISEAYAGRKGEGDEIWAFNLYIPDYPGAAAFKHETRRPRKLLLHKREIIRLLNMVGRSGVTLTPLCIYFNDRGLCKLQLGIAKGKKKVDKRSSIKERDWQRQKAKLLRRDTKG